MTSYDAARTYEPGREALVGPRLRARPRRSPPRHTAGYTAKRAVDLALAVFAILLLAPLLALIWLGVVLTSEGPGLYWSPRVGRFGRAFRMPKFRTMREGAPHGPRESLHEADALITPFGRLLRRYSLDELPQLFSIVAGHMSFVGPRPLLADDPGALAREGFPAALRARPGLSGLAQVRGRNRITARRKARLDAFYAGKASLGLDLAILYRTLVIVFTGRGFI